MKKIKNITVSVKYTVQLAEVEVTDEECKALEAVYDGGGQIYEDDIFEHENSEVSNDVLKRIINETDCVEHMYEIEYLKL